jgi:hypothetical protein
MSVSLNEAVTGVSESPLQVTAGTGADLGVAKGGSYTQVRQSQIPPMSG